MSRRIKYSDKVLAKAGMTKKTRQEAQMRLDCTCRPGSSDGCSASDCPGSPSD